MRLPASEYAEEDALVEELMKWITERQPAVINVAGNRDTRLEAPVEAVLFEVFRRIKEPHPNP